MGFLKFDENILRNISDSRINTKAILFSHFLGGLEPLVRVNSGNASGAETWAGSGNSTISDTPAAFPGICRITVGNTATGRIFIGSHVNAFSFGGGVCECETMFRTEILSTDLEAYMIRVGFIDNAVGESADGIYLRYAHNVNSGNWQLVARVNNVAVVKNLSIAVTTSYTKIYIRVNATGTLGELFINDVFIDNIIPSASFAPNRQCGYGILFTKTIGTTVRNILIDYMYMAINL